MLLQNPFGPASTTMQQPQQIPGQQPGQPPQILPGTSQDPNNKGSMSTPQGTVTDGTGEDTTTGGEGNDPMLDFGKLWNNDNADPNKQNQNQNEGFLPAIDPAKLQEHISKLDFSKVVTPEHRNAIIAGGEGAATALVDVINKTAQQVMLTAFTASHKMVEGGLKSAKSKFDGGIADHVKDVMTTNSLTSSNAVMRNPAFAPLVDGVRQQVLAKFPKATPSQVEAAVNKYFEDFAKELTAGSKGTQSTQTANSKTAGTDKDDWTDWLSSGPGGIGQNAGSIQL